MRFFLHTADFLLFLFFIRLTVIKLQRVVQFLSCIMCSLYWFVETVLQNSKCIFGSLISW
jgi:hypothetical protein